MWQQDCSIEAINNSIPDRLLRVGLVGAGYIAPYHIRFLRNIRGIDLVGIADLVPERAQRLAQIYGIGTACSAIEDLLDIGLDVLHVLTPAQTHFELASAGLQAGCHVLVEKPFTCSVSDCHRLEEEARHRDRRILVDYSLLGDPAVRRGLRIVNRGVIGRPRSLHLFRAGGAPQRAYRCPYPLLGDPFREVGTHALYCVTAFLGDITDAQVLFQSTGTQPSFRYDEWSVQVECERGVAQLHLTWTGPVQQTITVRGTKGRLQLDLGPNVVLKRRCWTTDRRIASAATPVAQSLSTICQVAGTIAQYCAGRYGSYKGIQTMIGDFYTALRSSRPMPIDFHRAQHVVEWTENITAAAEWDADGTPGRIPQADSAEVLLS